MMLMLLHVTVMPLSPFPGNFLKHPPPSRTERMRRMNVFPQELLSFLETGEKWNIDRSNRNILSIRRRRRRRRQR
jgi:hypothetical protein